MEGRFAARPGQSWWVQRLAHRVWAVPAELWGPVEVLAENAADEVVVAEKADAEVLAEKAVAEVVVAETAGVDVAAEMVADVAWVQRVRTRASRVLLDGTLVVVHRKLLSATIVATQRLVLASLLASEAVP